MFISDIRSKICSLLSSLKPNEKLWFIATNYGAVDITLYCDNFKDALFHCISHSKVSLSQVNLCIAVEVPGRDLRVEAVFDSEECTKLGYLYGLISPNGRRLLYSHIYPTCYRASITARSRTYRFVSSSISGLHKTFLEAVKSLDMDKDDCSVEISKIVDGKVEESSTLTYYEVKKIAG